LFKKLESLNLADNLKENIRNCIQIAKAATANGRRYSQEWLFECILLKIKNNGTYAHIYRHKIMPLPEPSTIRRYLRKLKPTYGFQSGVFDVLKAKAGAMKSFEKEGNTCS